MTRTGGLAHIPDVGLGRMELAVGAKVAEVVAADEEVDELPVVVEVDVLGLAQARDEGLDLAGQVVRLVARDGHVEALALARQKEEVEAAARKAGEVRVELLEDVRQGDQVLQEGVAAQRERSAPVLSQANCVQV